MASHTLRNRTVERTQQEDIFTSQGECDWPHDQPEQSDEVEIDENTQLSPAKVNKTITTKAQMTPTNTMTVNEIYAGNANANNQSECKTILASVLTKLDKLENKLKKLENKL
jgi:hypothetical protein